MKKNHHRKNRILLVCYVIFSQAVMSQTIEKWYVNMPDFLNPTLSKQNRHELLEYHKAGQGDSISNRFDHKAYLLELDTINQHIVVKNTKNSKFEMKILHTEDSTDILGIIRTICAPVCMSTIEFYDTAWNLIPVQFSMPKAIEWVDLTAIPSGKIDIQWVKSLMGISFISYTFDDKNQTLVAKNNTLDFISVEDRKTIAPYVLDKSISYGLKGRTWQRQP